MKRLESFVAHELRHRNFSGRMLLRDFAVDEGIIETRLRSISRATAEKHAIGPRPIDCSETHRAGLTGCVEITAAQLEVAKCLAGLANRQDFGVRRGIVRAGDVVGGFGDDFAVFDDDGTEGAAASPANIFDSELDCPGHEGAGHTPSIRWKKVSLRADANGFSYRPHSKTLFLTQLGRLTIEVRAALFR